MTNISAINRCHFCNGILKDRYHYPQPFTPCCKNCTNNIMEYPSEMTQKYYEFLNSSQVQRKVIVKDLRDAFFKYNNNSPDLIGGADLKFIEQNDNLKKGMEIQLSIIKKLKCEQYYLYTTCILLSLVGIIFAW